MKTKVLFASLILIMTACENKNGLNLPEQTQMPLAPAYQNSFSSDTAKAQEAFNEPVKKQVIKRAARTKKIHHTLPEMVINEPALLPPLETVPVVTAPVSTVPDVNTPPSAAAPVKTETSAAPESIPQPEEKKGWSKAAKGTVIGAGTGAIGGAILSKKKGKGAIIGGILGAAGGYVIGKKMDKKDNRFTGD